MSVYLLWCTFDIGIEVSSMQLVESSFSVKPWNRSLVLSNKVDVQWLPALWSPIECKYYNLSNSSHCLSINNIGIWSNKLPYQPLCEHLGNAWLSKKAFQELAQCICEQTSCHTMVLSLFLSIWIWSTRWCQQSAKALQISLSYTTGKHISPITVLDFEIYEGPWCIFLNWFECARIIIAQCIQ